MPGAQGPPGNQGAPGTPGQIGPAGPQGPVGPQGSTGADSTVPGPVGPAGPQGATGAASTVPGPQGPAGPTGSTGAQGPIGATGPQGPQGVAGAGTPSTTPPQMDSTATVGTSTNFSREDHIHPSDTSRAPLNSPAFTGAPTAPTPAAADNSTRLATTAFSAANEVRTDIVQTLTAAQQAQARSNIYAAPFDALAYNGMQINGSMAVSQFYGTTAAGLVNTQAYIVDGWIAALNSSSLTITGQQVTDAPPGYSASMKISVTSPSITPAAGDYCVFFHKVEGYRSARLGFGTASASPVSIGFWAKVNRAGLYSGALKNGADNRSYPFTFTMNGSATWQFVTITIPGDTAGTWASDNTAGIQLTLCMMAGTTYSGPTGAWASVNYLGANAINGVAASSDYMQITGAIILPGIELPSAARAPFIMRPFGLELGMCQRYFEKSYDYATLPGGISQNGIALSVGQFPASNIGGLSAIFKERKRAVPTMTAYSPGSGGAGLAHDGPNNVDLSVSWTGGIGESCAACLVTIGATSTLAISMQWTADARL